jgi:thioredoxin 2
MSESSHVVCQNCNGIVKVPAGRLADGPKCPRCQTALFDGKPIELNDQTFERHVQKGDLPVVVDFWAPWCAPCRAMAPVFAAAAQRHEPLARFAKVNTEEAQGTAAKFAIRSIPTLVVFRNGREVARQPGAMDPRSLDSWLSRALS